MIGLGLDIWRGALSGGGGGGAATLLGSETQGLSIDFTDLSMVIRDTGTPANTFSGNPNSKLTYTSPSTKWIRNSAGVLVSGTTLRCEYDASANPLGTPFEEARTNLALQSQDFSTTWTRAEILAFGSGSTVNAAVAPDGTTTADLVTPSTVSATHYVEQSGLSASASTFSTWVKAAGYSKVMLFFGGTNNGALFDLSAVTANATGGALANAVTSASIQSYTNGWYRIAATSTTSSSTARVYVLQDFTNATFAADGTSGVYLWGAQFEVGSFVTSYIQTVASTVTRARDNVSMLASLAPVSATVGTLFARYIRRANTNQYAFSLNGGASSSDIVVSPSDSGGTSRALIVNATTQANVAVAETAIGTVGRMSMSWEANSVLQSTDGVAGTEDTVASIPTVSQFNIGDRVGGGRPFNGHVQALVYLPRKRTEAENNTASAP